MDITIIEEDGVHVRTVVEDRTADGKLVRIGVRVSPPWYIKTEGDRRIPNPNPYDPDNPDRWALDGTESPELVAAAHDNANHSYNRLLRYARRAVARKVSTLDAGGIVAAACVPDEVRA